MKNKIFLSSMLIMSVAPAMAEPSNTGEFPTGGLMQEDYTYTGAATSTNMDGVYEGSVNATAEYEDVLYQIAAGKYLPAGAESPIDCNVAGSFCAGVQNGVYYDANNNQGLTSCSTATNGAYTLSAGTGTSADSCYRTCDVNNMGASFTNIPHAKTVSGNDYYGNGTDTCVPTECMDGWHVKTGVNGSAIASTIGNEAGSLWGWINNAGEEQQQTTTLGISDKNTWAVEYDDKGVLIGQTRCSTVQGDNNNVTWTNPTITSNLTDETGQAGAQYCYCNVSKYNGVNSEPQSLSSSWIFVSSEGDADYCANNCTFRCAYNMRYADSSSLRFRATLLETVESGPAMCEANIININWSNADAADITANNAGTATYGSDVRTPVKAQTIKGKTFKGWRFSKPQSCTSITDQSTCVNNGSCTWIGDKCFVSPTPSTPSESGGGSD